VLRALCRAPEGQPEEALAAQTGLGPQALKDALQALERHDVVVGASGRWRVAVELMRRWVLEEIEGG
jgi:hypothetical protein